MRHVLTHPEYDLRDVMRDEEEQAEMRVVNMAAAWQELEARAPVKLGSIRNERHFKAMTEFMNELLDETGDRESHPLAGLLEVVTMFVRDYEDRQVQIPEASPPPCCVS